MLSRRRFLSSGGAAIAIASCVAMTGCGLASKPVFYAADAITHTGSIGRYGRLTKLEKQWAATAWRYFQNNTNPENGLVNGMDRVPTFSMWHVGDYLASLMAAKELDLIEAREFDTRLSALLEFLNTMDMSEASVPNKLYNTLSGKMVTYENQPGDLGWSAIETGRLLAWMRIMGERYPQYREYFDRVVYRMNFCTVIDDCGQLRGSAKNKGQRTSYQEGRLGYEQLGAAGFAAWGFDARRIWKSPPIETVNIYGMPVRYDGRESRQSGVQTPVLTMPYILMGMEFGWRYPGRGLQSPEVDFQSMANEIYRVQEERYRREGILTARTDYALREPPYLVLDSVFGAGYPWNTIGPDGKEFPKLAMVSTRAAFGMWALWPTDYTDRLVASIQNLYSPERGWYEGRLEYSGAVQENISLSTNAAVLEALLFKVKGQLFPSRLRSGFLDRQLDNPYDRTNRCFPTERPVCNAVETSGNALDTKASLLSKEGSKAGQR